VEKFAPDETAKLTREELARMIARTKSFDELTGPIASLVTIARLRETEKTMLRKMIAKKTGTRIKDLEADAKAYKEIQADKDMLHLQAARETIHSFGEGNLLYAQGWFWRWDSSGIWHKLTEKESVKRHIHRVAESQELTDSIANSIYGLCKTEAFEPEVRFDQSNEDVINCLSGELVLRDSNWQLLPHNREHYRITQIPVVYQPEARAPRFEQFLEEVFANDPDASDKCRLVCELLGYTLLCTCRFERFVILIGKGSNGKSVLLRVLKELVGTTNCAAVQPAEFDNRFQRAHLHGKLANIVSEVEQGAMIPDAALKAIVSGEAMTAEHKFCDPFDFSPYATCWFGTNHMPGTRDFSDALFRRAVTIDFNRQFAEHQRDVHLADKLIRELPGILNLALEAIANVIAFGSFTRPASCETTKAYWRNENDQAAQFVDECCKPLPDHWVESAIVYRRYLDWTHEAGIQKPLNRKNLTTRLAALGYANGKGTGGVRRIHGLLVEERHYDF
jgi:putative DNA primase/helicase